MFNGYEHNNYENNNFANCNQNSHHPKHTSHQQYNNYNDKNPQYSDSPKSSQMRESTHSLTNYQPAHVNQQNQYKHGYKENVFQRIPIPDNYHRYPSYQSEPNSMMHQKSPCPMVPPYNPAPVQQSYVPIHNSPQKSPCPIVPPDDIAPLQNSHASVQNAHAPLENSQLPTQVPIPYPSQLHRQNFQNNGYEPTNHYEDNYSVNQSKYSHPTQSVYQQIPQNSAALANYYNYKNSQFSSFPQSYQIRVTNRYPINSHSAYQSPPCHNQYKNVYDQDAYQKVPMPDNYYKNPSQSAPHSHNSPYQRVPPPSEDSKVYRKVLPPESDPQNLPYQMEPSPHAYHRVPRYHPEEMSKTLPYQQLPQPKNNLKKTVNFIPGVKRDTESTLPSAVVTPIIVNNANSSLDHSMIHRTGQYKSQNTPCKMVPHHSPPYAPTPVQNYHLPLPHSYIPVQNDHLPVQNDNLSIQNDHLPVQNIHLPAQNSHLLIQNSQVAPQNPHVPIKNYYLLHRQPPPYHSEQIQCKNGYDQNAYQKVPMVDSVVNQRLPQREFDLQNSPHQMVPFPQDVYQRVQSYRPEEVSNKYVLPSKHNLKKTVSFPPGTKGSTESMMPCPAVSPIIVNNAKNSVPTDKTKCNLCSKNEWLRICTTKTANFICRCSNRRINVSPALVNKI